MHRFFVEPNLLRDAEVTLPEVVAHQVRSVLRMSVGERIMLLDNLGWQYRAELNVIGKGAVVAQVIDKQPAEGEPIHHLTLYQSLLKRDKFEWVLQKGTELGVSRFVPVISQRSVADKVRDSKHARWERILTEAAEQCRRGRIPSLAAPVTFSAALDEARAEGGGWECALMPDESSHATPGIYSALSAAPQPPRRLALFIGPEGGFTREECAAATEREVVLVSLGKRILRAETAALAAAALCLSALGELGD